MIWHFITLCQSSTHHFVQQFVRFLQYKPIDLLASIETEGKCNLWTCWWHCPYFGSALSLNCVAFDVCCALPRNCSFLWICRKWLAFSWFVSCIPNAIALWFLSLPKCYVLIYHVLLFHSELIFFLYYYSSAIKLLWFCVPLFQAWMEFAASTEAEGIEVFNWTCKEKNMDEATSWPFQWRLRMINYLHNFPCTNSSMKRCSPFV